MLNYISSVCPRIHALPCCWFFSLFSFLFVCLCLSGVCLVCLCLSSLSHSPHIPPPPPPPKKKTQINNNKKQTKNVRSVSARVSDLEADNAALRRDSCRSQQTEGILLLPKYRIEPLSHPSLICSSHLSHVRISKTAHPHLGPLLPHLQLYSHLHPTLIISGLPSNEASDLPSSTIITHLQSGDSLPA